MSDLKLLQLLDEIKRAVEALITEKEDLLARIEDLEAKLSNAIEERDNALAIAYPSEPN